MKQNFLVLLSCFVVSIALIITFNGCSKHDNSSVVGQAISTDPQISSAIDYLKDNLSETDFASLNLRTVEKFNTDQSSAILKIHELNSSQEKYLFYIKDKSGYSVNWIDEEMQVNNKAANGILRVTSLDKSISNEYTFVNNNLVSIVRSQKGQIQTQKISFRHTSEGKTIVNAEGMTVSFNEQFDNGAPPMPTVYVYPSYDGYNDTYTSTYYLSGGNDQYYAQYTLTATGGGGAPTTTYAPTYMPSTYPITSLENELKCFASKTGSTYSITVQINEPIPGSRMLANVGAQHMVGHTYVTLEEDDASGSKVIRNIGFYPIDGANPWNGARGMQWGEDSQTMVDVSLKISVSGSDFMTYLTAMGAIDANPHTKYVTTTYNCTTEAIASLTNINIHLPSTPSTAPLFNGYNDPGDLGEDIRGLNLTTFLTQDGNRPVTKTVSNDNTRLPPAKTGSCP